MAATKQIDSEVRDVLATVEWDGAAARLTCGQLDRKLYVKVNDVLESLGGKWNKKAMAHLFEADAQSELEAAIETGVYLRAADLRQIFGEFETPDSLADELVSRLGPLRGSPDLLEPSAGGGNLLKALRRAYPKILDYRTTAVEIQEKRHSQLVALATNVVIGDFLSLDKAICGLGSFHYVLMNPPFGNQADIDHVQHAWKFLASGGRLVAIMSPGFTFRTNKKSVAFREFSEQHGSWTENPPGSFKVSGTGVSTVMLTLDRE